MIGRLTTTKAEIPYTMHLFHTWHARKAILFHFF